MSQSGVPVVSQAGSLIGNAGGAVGAYFGGIPGLVAGRFSQDKAEQIMSPKVPAVGTPPTLATGTNAQTAKSMQDAQEDPTVNRARGMAANMLAGSSGQGLLSSSNVSRNILLGN